MGADAKIAARLGGAQEDVTRGAVLREILPRVRGIEFARSFELSRAGEAVSHVAHGRQPDTGSRGRFPYVLVASHPDGVLTLRRDQRNVEALGLHAYRVTHEGLPSFPLRGPQQTRFWFAGAVGKGGDFG